MMDSMWRFAPSRSKLLTTVLIALAAGTAWMAAGEPLTNVDIVRMTAARMPPDEIVLAIRSAPSTRFDLDPEIVEELVLAGVASEVIEAMRQARHGTSPPPAPADPISPAASLEIVFSREAVEGKRPGVLISDTDREGSRTSLAFFVICVEPTHVPDSWAARSSLGGGFPRHELLWFHEANRPVKGSGRLSLIEIDVPERHAISLPAGRHVLELGVAARFEGLDWIPLARTTARVEASAERGLEVLVRLLSENIGLDDVLAGRPPGYECEILGIRQADPVKDGAP